MSKSGDEMIMELAASLGGMNKTAAKKDDDKKDEKKKEDKKECEKCDGKCKCDEDKKDDKKDKKDKKDDKKEAVMGVLHGLSKLAAELDEVGADDASSLVDEALRVIVQNLDDEKKKVTARLWSEDEPDEDENDSVARENLERVRDEQMEETELFEGYQEEEDPELLLEEDADEDEDNHEPYLDLSGLDRKNRLKKDEDYE